MRIGANIPSWQVYNSMTKASKALGKASLRMSSGIKLNSASDDPAGLAIANKIRLQVRGLEQASMNSSNGMSMIQTAEGALTEMHNMMQRIRELAVAAANDTNEPEDRRKMQDEIDQLIEEINDIPFKTEYNKIRLLSGECDRIMYNYTTGSTAQTDNVNILRMSDTTPYGELLFTVDALGTKAAAVMGGGATATLPDAALDGHMLYFNDTVIKMEPGETRVSLLEKLRDVADRERLTITEGAPPNLIASIESLREGSDQKIHLDGSPALMAALGLSPADVSGTDAEVSGLGGKLDPTTAAVTTLGNRVTITGQNRLEIVFDLNANLNVATDGAQSIFTKLGPLNVQVGANKDMAMYMTIPRMSGYTSEVDRANVLTRERAGETITLMDKCIEFVSSVRSRLGAYQNRLEYTVSSLDNAVVDATQSLSRVEDTDMAREMTEYTSKNVMYQAGVAIMAQANQRPQAILQLLQ